MSTLASTPGRVSPRVVRSLGPDLARGMLLLLIASANVWGYLWSQEGYNEAGAGRWAARRWTTLSTVS